jgi:hypothetical protein
VGGSPDLVFATVGAIWVPSWPYLSSVQGVRDSLYPSRIQGVAIQNEGDILSHKVKLKAKLEQAMDPEVE